MKQSVVPALGSTGCHFFMQFVHASLSEKNSPKSFAPSMGWLQILAHSSHVNLLGLWISFSATVSFPYICREPGSYCHSRVCKTSVF
jgi:hypothetical protein